MKDHRNRPLSALHCMAMVKQITAASLAAITLWAQTPPTIRVSTLLVEVSVVVRDKNGPVANLTQDDFTLLDQGKAQKITSFSVSNLSAQASAAAATGAAPSPMAPNVYSNRPETKVAMPANTTVVLLDGLNTMIRDQNYVKRQFLTFLKQIRATDRVAVYSLGTQLTVVHEFTSDSARLVASVAKYTGANVGATDASNPKPSDSGDFIVDSWLNDSAGIISDQAFADRASTTAAALEAIAHHIARLPGRKSLVWISGSFPLSIGHMGADGVNNWEDAAYDQQIAMAGSGVSRTSVSASTKGTGGMTQGSTAYGANIRDGNPAREQATFIKLILQATKALSDADIAVYPVDARGLIAQPANMTAEGSTSVSRSSVLLPKVTGSVVPVGHAAMQAVAENTGGLVYENTNDLKGAIRNAIDDGQVTYTLTFSPDASTMNGKFHPLKVTVKRPGMEVRFRKGYLASADARPADADRAIAIHDALLAPMESLGIALTAGIEKDQPKPGGISVTLAVEPKDVGFQQNAGKYSAILDATFSLRSADGHELGTSTQALNLNLPQTQYEAVLKDGMTFTKNLDGKPGVTEVRVVVYDRGNGRVGSIILPVK